MVDADKAVRKYQAKSKGKREAREESKTWAPQMLCQKVFAKFCWSDAEVYRGQGLGPMQERSLRKKPSPH